MLHSALSLIKINSGIMDNEGTTDVGSKTTAQRRLVGRLGRITDLLPIEKKLIVGSLILGVVLLGLLMWVSRVFFPAG
jgi:hypothetical protein